MIQLLAGDCRTVLPTLAADSVQCVVTSPPYYGLRDYGTALWDGGDAACDHTQKRSMGATTLRLDGREHLGAYEGEKATQIGTPYRGTCGKCGATRIDRQIGLEATPEAFIATMVAVFREIRRVLRPDGTCWVNMGDSYNANQGTGFDTNRDGGGRKNFTMSPKVSSGGLAAKQLLMMPARLALALQADGWWLRSAITWCKPSPMPESCTDRPTSATEMVYLLTKRAHYFYDSIAIREDAVSDHPSGNGYKREPRLTYADGNGARGNDAQWSGVGGTRNARNWWVINSKPFPQAHFATYPPELAERCIRAGTSERGACSQCGAPWIRTTETEFVKLANRRPTRKAVQDGSDMADINSHNAMGYNNVTTTGWAPGCRCGTTVVPCRVLDPFAGAGTTLLVADRLQRDAIGIELSPDYTRMAMQRCQDDAPLFTSFPPAETDAQDERMADLFADAEYHSAPASTSKVSVPSGWDTGPGAHGTIHRTGRTVPEAAD